MHEPYGANRELRSILGGAGWVLPIQLGSALLGYVSQIAAARWMGTREYSVYTYAYTWLLLLASVVCLGFDNAALRFIPDYVQRRCWSEFRAFLRFTATLPLVAGIVLATLGTAIVIGLRLQHHEYASIVLFALWIVPVQALAQIGMSYCRSLNAPVLAYLPLFVGFRCLFIAGAFLVFRAIGGLTSWAAMAVTAISLVLVFFLQSTGLWLLLPAELVQYRPVYDKSLWLETSWMMWLSAALENCRARSHLLILSAMLPPIHVGIYYAAERTAMLVAFVLAAVNALGGPRLAALYAQGENELLQTTLERLAHWIFWPSLAAALLLWWSSHSLFALFGREFGGAEVALSILLVGLLFDAGVGPVGNLLNLTGNQRVVAEVTGCAIVVGVILDLFLIPLAGVAGAAAGASMSLLVLDGLLYWLTVRRLTLRPSIVDGLLALIWPGEKARIPDARLHSNRGLDYGR